jgi:hypothetical protein
MRQSLPNGSHIRMATDFARVCARRVCANHLFALQPLHIVPVIFIFRLAKATDLVVAAIGATPGPDKLVGAGTNHEE